MKLSPHFIRAIAAVLFTVGLWFAAIGIQKWFTEAEVSETAAGFVEAVLCGDREAVQPYLASELSAQGDHTKPWSPSPGFLYRIMDVGVNDRDATARVRIKQGEFVADPIIHLHFESGRWRVVRVAQYHFRRFDEGNRAILSRIEGDRVAVELEHAFQNEQREPPSSIASAPEGETVRQ